MERERFYEELVQFLHDLSVQLERRPPPDGIGEDDNLFDVGAVDSFSMIRMVVHIEQMTGTMIDLQRHDPELFYTMRGLYDVAFPQGATR